MQFLNFNVFSQVIGIISANQKFIFNFKCLSCNVTQAYFILRKTYMLQVDLEIKAAYLWFLLRPSL